MVHAIAGRKALDDQPASLDAREYSAGRIAHDAFLVGA
jgi:hypothetical protein